MICHRPTKLYITAFQNTFAPISDIFILVSFEDCIFSKHCFAYIDNDNEIVRTISNNFTNIYQYKAMLVHGYLPGELGSQRSNRGSPSHHRERRVAVQVGRTDPRCRAPLGPQQSEASSLSI